MKILIPLLSALADAAGLIVAKVILTRRQISLRDHNPVTFLFVFVFSAALLPFFGPLNLAAVLRPPALEYLAAIIVVGAGWNALYYLSVQKKKVNSSEGVINLMPLLTIGLVWIVFPAKFNPNIAMAAGVGALALMWGFWDKNHLAWDRYNAMMLAAMVLVAVENLLVGRALQRGLFSPVLLYTIRTFMIFIIFYAYSRPKMRRIKPVNLAWLAFASVLGVVTMILRFYGLRDSGIAYTGLILIVTPVAVYTASAVLLHERLKRRQIIATIILLGAILYATIAA